MLLINPHICQRARTEPWDTTLSEVTPQQADLQLELPTALLRCYLVSEMKHRKAGLASLALKQ